MTRSQADNWSAARSLAFLAAVFALALGSLLPFAALAAARPGHPLVICSAEGPQTLHAGGVEHKARMLRAALDGAEAGVRCHSAKRGGCPTSALRQCARHLRLVHG